MNEREVIHHALDNVQREGIIIAKWREINNTKKDDGIDGKLKLEFNKHKVELYAQVKNEVRNIHLEKIDQIAVTNEPFIIIAQRIFPKIKKELRKKNIAYMEANGNIFLNKDEMFICIDGNEPVEEKNKTTNRAFTKTGLQVIYQFLINDKWVNRTYRDIVERTGTGIGNINNIFNGLKQEGYLLQLTKNEQQIADKKKLLERWIVEYEKKLKPTLAIGTFRFLKADDFDNWRNIKLKNQKTYWGGEPAGAMFTDYLRPEELTIYTAEDWNDLIKNYRLVPDQNGNVKVFKKFWKYDEANYDLVHPLLAYADLINKGDRRCTETAQRLYDEYLQNNL